MNLTATLTIQVHDAEAMASVCAALAALRPAVAVRSAPVATVGAIASVPAPPLSAAAKASIERIEAAAPPVKRGPGRPPKVKVEWQPPVPRPATGLYGKQEPPTEGAAEWTATRDGYRQRLQYVLNALRLAGLDHEKFMKGLMVRYGDGQFLSTVPQGNLEALVAEAEAGPSDHPLTAEQLKAAGEEYERRLASKEGSS